MATYDELYALRSNTALRNRIRVAVTKKAQALIALAAPSNAQLVWARDALNSPESKADAIFAYLLAANSAATVSQIETATDATIQGHVDAAADKLLTIT